MRVALLCVPDSIVERFFIRCLFYMIANELEHYNKITHNTLWECSFNLFLQNMRETHTLSSLQSR